MPQVEIEVGEGYAVKPTDSRIDKGCPVGKHRLQDTIGIESIDSAARCRTEEQVRIAPVIEVLRSSGQSREIDSGQLVRRCHVRADSTWGVILQFR